MNLWLLSFPGGMPSDVISAVVRAKTESEARALVFKFAQDRSYEPDGLASPAEVWLNPERTACEKLWPDGIPGVICVDVYEP